MAFDFGSDINIPDGLVRTDGEFLTIYAENKSNLPYWIRAGSILGWVTPVVNEDQILEIGRPCNGTDATCRSMRMAYELSQSSPSQGDAGKENKKDDCQGVTEPCKSSGSCSYDRERESFSEVHETPFVVKEPRRQSTSWNQGTVASYQHAVIEGVPKEP